jgi:predicted lipoprotein with Yx(FWY)xxD motif
VTITSSAGTLVGPNGHTLYENTVDTATSITCTGACAAAWPPVTGNPVVGAGLNASDFATATRPDGTMQVTFQGHPLYYFAADTSAGSMAGNGKADQGGSWHSASASAVSTTGGTSSAPPTMNTSTSGGYGGGGY